MEAILSGPVCDYSVAPIARFSYHWGIPLLTAGALVSDFHNKLEYKLLTRMQGSYAEAVRFFLFLFETFRWKRVGMVYHDFSDQSHNDRSDCFFFMESVYLAVARSEDVTWYTSFDEREEHAFLERLMEVPHHARSKRFSRRGGVVTIWISFVFVGVVSLFFLFFFLFLIIIIFLKIFFIYFFKLLLI